MAVNCPDCGGTGKFVCFTSIETCKRCAGFGWLYTLEVKDAVDQTDGSESEISD